MQIALIFLSNQLLHPDVRHHLKVPLSFVSFAHIKGKMYRHEYAQSTFQVEENKGSWGNKVVYGAIFQLLDFSFHIHALDAYHSCSLSSLKRNHTNDWHHRILTQATPISFDTLDDFERLKYYERETVRVYMYVGNPNHPTIKKKLNTRIYNSRIVDGVDKRNFLALAREVLT